MSSIVDQIKENYLFILITSIILVILLFLMIYIYKKFLKRIETTKDLPETIKNIKLKGRVIKVGDGDGFQFFHVPFLRSSKYKKGDKLLKIRLAGVDAPEVRHFDVPAQPYSKEAKLYLQKLILNEMVTIEMYIIDMYGRIVAGVFKKKGWFQTENISLKMVEKGLACVYVGMHAQYGNFEKKLINAQKEQQMKGNGMWSLKEKTVLPMAFKAKHKKKKK